MEKPTVLCGLAALVLALGFGFFTGNMLSETGVSYAVLRVDPSYSDRQLRSLLDGAGIEPVISESGQRVFYDDFGGIETVPLDLYRERIDSLDPRDDGYAEKLRSVFTDGTERRLFFPLRSAFFSGTPGALRKKISLALADIPHSFETEGFSRPLVFPLLVFAGVVLLMLFLFRRRRLFVFALPLLGVLAWFGPPGFVLAALLRLMFELLAPLMEEWTALSGMERPFFQKPFTRHLAVVLLALIWTGLFAVSGIPFPLFFILPFALFLAWLSLWRKKALSRRLGHTRFIPLSIIPEQGLFRESFPVLLPFALGAAVIFAFPLFFRGVNLYHGGEMHREITRADFEDHLSFQKEFSHRPLGEPEGRGGAGYAVYTLDSDGLIGSFSAAPRDVAMPGISAGDTALFTLFENPPAPAVFPDLFWTAGLCALLLPAWFLRARAGEKKGVSVRYSDKRIAA
ncbi:MAG: hypothetical protein LBI85_06095 [Spirochaetaceae bacterium]|jgi:hypothetical protein|nr:hypothetical protein [Spirochaetaceae bacterium]